MKWTIEDSITHGLYDVYNEHGNWVVRHTTYDRARLIAAAPDLRAALEALVAAVEACETVADWWLLPSGEAMREARAVLAKTEKEKPK